MGYAQETTDASGVNVKFERDTITGVLTQNAGSTKSGTARAADDNLSFATPLLVCATSLAVGAGGDKTNTVLIFDANCPYKMRVVDAWIIPRETGVSGGTPDEDIQILNGTDAITDAIDIDAVADNTRTAFGTFDDAYDEIAVDGTLKIEHVLSGGVDGGTSIIEIYILLMPVK